MLASGFICPLRVLVGLLTVRSRIYILLLGPEPLVCRFALGDGDSVLRLHVLRLYVLRLHLFVPASTPSLIMRLTSSGLKISARKRSSCNSSKDRSVGPGYERYLMYSGRVQ